jgi:hypothetical protein
VLVYAFCLCCESVVDTALLERVTTAVGVAHLYCLSLHLHSLVVLVSVIGEDFHQASSFRYLLALANSHTCKLIASQLW